MISKRAKAARTAIGVIGNVISFGLFVAPVPTIKRIWQKKTAEEFRPDPYIATCMNCLFWIFYGIPVVHPDSTLVVTINAIGLALELGYLALFFMYTHKKNRLKIVFGLLAEMVFIAAIAAATLLGFHTHAKRSLFVGIFCVVFGIIMYASPCTIMTQVYRTKSVEFMPLWLSVAGFTNGSVWLTYALIEFDLFILISNAIGAVFGLLQLLMYAYYFWKPKPKDDVKPSEIQIPNTI